MRVHTHIKRRLLDAKERGMEVTQRTLAAALGVKEPVMSRIVTGEMQPTRKQADEMAKHLGCEVQDLYPTQVLAGLQLLWDAADAAAGT